MQKTVRGELKGAGNWTHQYCTPANNNCSSDTLAAGPLGVLWFEDWGFEMPSRHGRGHAPLLLDGRLFVQGLSGLLAVDAYNGRKLWEYPLPGILKEYSADHIMGTSGTGSNFCVTGDSLYVRVKGKCLRIDPASGRLLAEFEAPRQPDGKPGTWGVAACVGDTLFGSLDNTEHVIKWAWKPAEMGTQFTESLLFFAMDRITGKVKWTYAPMDSIRHNAIAIGLGRVFLIDRPMALSDRLDSEAERRGEPAKKETHAPGRLVALDAASGKVAWRSADTIVGTLLALSEQHDVLLATYQDTRFKIASEVGGKMSAYRATDGKLLWDIAAKYGSRPILNDRTIYAQPGAWDLLTGKEKDFEFSRSYGCGTLAGSTKMLVYRSATLGYTDLSANRGNENFGGIRPGCWINTLPAGGLVLMPDATDRCTCSYLIKSSIALQRR
jgi:outer membrane protein assembly factor BamB